MGIDVKKTTLEAVLSNRRKFRVAPYQRKYEWNAVQMGALIDDLVSSGAPKASVEGRDPYHFLGSFIFHRKRGEAHIIDGQQRLTSLSILLAVARDMVRADGKLRHTLHSYVVDPGASQNATPVKRISHHRGDEEFYEALVGTPGGTKKAASYVSQNEQEERFRMNTHLAWEKIKFLASDADIAAFRRHVVEQCEIIEISVDEKDDAFRIFATVNGRGQPVRDQDILRVTLIEEAVSEAVKRKTLLRIWDEAERALGSADFERYLRLRRFSNTGVWDVSSCLLGKASADFGEGQKLAAFLERELESECQAFSFIEKCGIAWRHNRRQYPFDYVLRSMSLVSFDEWYAVAITLFRKFAPRPSEFDRAELMRWLRKLERLVWRFEFDTGDKHVEKNRRERFGSILKYFRNHSRWSLEDSGIDLISKEKRDMMTMLRSELDPQLPALRNILIRIEQSLRGRFPWEVVRDYCTIEHVLPKSGGGADWERDMKLSPAELKGIALELGNLCIVPWSINKAMGEKSFAEKQAIAVEKDIGDEWRLAKDLSEQPAWTRDLIKARTEKFAQKLGRELNLE